jgi:hypothetical protein
MDESGGSGDKPSNSCTTVITHHLRNRRVDKMGRKKGIFLQPGCWKSIKYM